MRNHDHKNRDMARSILPSTARHLARKRKKASSRRARARNDARLRRVMAQLDDLDGVEEPLDRYDLEEDDRIEMIGDRRAADKVAPLARWAEVRIARNPRLTASDRRARRNHFAALLGDTVAGRHALDHLDPLFGEQNPFFLGGFLGGPTPMALDQHRRDAVRAEHEARRHLLEAVLAGADARRLNQRISALTPPIERHWRLDAGGKRIPDRPSGYEPWLFDGDAGRWLAVPRRGPTGAQRIAFDALAEVHAEMFPPASP